MKVSYRNILTKIEKAGGKTGVIAPFTGADGSAPSASSTPKTPKTPKGKGGRPSKRKAENTGSDEDEDAPKSLRKKAAKNMVKAHDEDEDDDDETHKTPKKAGRPRKTPVKPTKSAMSKAVDGDEDVADNSDGVVGKAEATQDDGKTSEVIKEEDQSES